MERSKQTPEARSSKYCETAKPGKSRGHWEAVGGRLEGGSAGRPRQDSQEGEQGGVWTGHGGARVGALAFTVHKLPPDPLGGVLVAERHALTWAKARAKQARGKGVSGTT